MKDDTLIDFNNCPISNRNGIYGGNDGAKEGVIFNDEYWLIKYPKNIRNSKSVDMSFSTSPLSEYIGSHVYELLGYDVHNTVLGTRNGKIVVGCKDFCNDRRSLVEMRTLKNIYNDQLHKVLKQNISSTSRSHKIDIDEILIHIKYNPILLQTKGLSDRFWDMMVIDIFIANNDRNNEDWGVLYTSDGYKLAPVFDNGSSFYNRMSDSEMMNMMENMNNFNETVINSSTVFSKHGNELPAKKIISFDEYPGLKEALKRNVPLLMKYFEDIKEFIRNIPNEYNDLEVISDIRRDYYLKSIETRFEKLFLPVYEKILKEDMTKEQQ